MAHTPHTRRRFLRDAGLAGAAVSALPMLGPPGTRAAQARAAAGDWASHPNPIVRENRATPSGSWSRQFQVATTTGSDVVTGFAKQTSVNVGEPAELVLIGPNRYYGPPLEDPVETARADVYRLGWYGGEGGRLVWSSPTIPTWQKYDAQGQPASGGAEPEQIPNNAPTGAYGFGNHRVNLTVPAAVLGVSGVYLARLHTQWYDFPPGVPGVRRTGEAHVIFIVRDDERPRDLLVQLPTNTWQAYNYSTGRSVYTVERNPDLTGSIVPATGTERAAKVSFDRPHNNWVANLNWVLRTEFPAIWWLEQHGFDLTFTEDVAVSFQPEQLLPELSGGVVILGHGEYWTQEIRDGLEAARDAGTHIFNFGANTAYWRVRYETPAGEEATSIDEARVMSCYKTIEGAPNGGSVADPKSPTTTWRDPGHGPGVDVPGTTHPSTPNYVGPDRPEAELLGVQYFGADGRAWYPLVVPGDNGTQEFAGHRAWRHTPLYKAAQPTTSTSPSLVGWEWDAVPAAGDPFGGKRPAVHPRSTGLKRLSETDPRALAPPGNGIQYLLDAGRSYTAEGTAAGAAPPVGTDGKAHAVTYRAPSGAVVFSAGTIQWSWGLAPHYQSTNGSPYTAPRIDTDTDPLIQQATLNLLVDEGIYPSTLDDPALIVDPLSEPDLELPLPDPDPDPDPDPGPGNPPQDPPANPGPPAPNPPTTPNPPSSPNPPEAPVGPTRLIFDLDGTRVTRTGRIEGRVRLNSTTAKVASTVRGKIELTAMGDTIARGRFTIRRGGRRSTMLRLRLSPWARRYLGRKNELRLTAQITVTGGEAGPKRTRTRLRVSRAKRR